MSGLALSVVIEDLHGRSYTSGSISWSVFFVNEWHQNHVLDGSNAPKLDFEQVNFCKID